MTVKEEKMICLYERQGYLDYLLEVTKEDRTEESMLEEIKNVVDEIALIAINIYDDFPDVVEYLKKEV